VIYLVIILSGAVGGLSVKVFNDNFYINGDKVRFDVWNYYLKNYNRYKDHFWCDVIFDYCHDKKKRVKDIVNCFEKGFLKEKVHSSKMPV